MSDGVDHNSLSRHAFVKYLGYDTVKYLDKMTIEEASGISRSPLNPCTQANTQKTNQKLFRSKGIFLNLEFHHIGFVENSSQIVDIFRYFRPDSMLSLFNVHR